MKSIRKPLHVMTCALLADQAHALEVIDNAWQIDSSLLYYTEDERVDVIKTVVTAKGKISDSDSVAIKTVYDTMSGATPSGARSGNTNVSFTGASGGGVASSGEAAPLAEFDDTRLSMNIDWEMQANRQTSYLFNGGISVENDYRSFSLGGTWNREYSNKTRKLTAGLAGSYDQIFRVGGNDTPVGLSLVSDQQSLGEGEKTTVDGIVGLTMVLNQRTVAQFNLGASLSQGYLTDPYKQFSIVDVNGVPYEQYYEKRPESRMRYTLAMNVNHQRYPQDDIFHASYRFYTDDWGVDSHTIETSMTIPLRERKYWEPVFRLYRQSEADFYADSFTQDPADPTPVSSLLPDYLSADYRLDAMTGITLGATYGLRGVNKDNLRFKLALTRWAYDNSEFDALDVIVVQASYGKKF